MYKINQYVIAEISDNDFKETFISKDNTDKYCFRRASRGILINGNKIAIINVSKKKHHKLPGGGIKIYESNQTAFKREIKEETGCECKLLKNINQNSIVLEKREQYKFIQISYIFFSKIVGKPQQTKLMQDEIDDGFKLEWVTINQAIRIFKMDKPTDYKVKFIQKRDISILKFYQKNYKDKKVLISGSI